jgi:NADPH:quinone reductase-like Zn-dependent oxidoreductase
MKALRLERYEADPRLVEIGAPRPGAGEVLVRVGHAALNPLDVKLRGGGMSAWFPLDFPYTVGTDLSGTIEALGPDVSGWSAGDRIAARLAPTAGGAVAQYAVVPADQLVPLPSGIEPAHAAGLATTGGTAWQALVEIACLKAGQTVLIHAGAGGVGSFAIQIARRIGARVIATASGDGIALAERLGADQVIDYRSRDFAADVSDVDVVLDTVGGDTQTRSFAVLRSSGTLVSTVAPPDGALATAHGVTATFVFHTSDAARLAQVVGAASDGVRVVIDRVVPLAQAAKAFAHQAGGQPRGKVIIAIQG